MNVKSINEQKVTLRLQIARKLTKGSIFVSLNIQSFHLPAFLSLLALFSCL